MIKFRCSRCHRKISANEEHMGMGTECPNCSAELSVPSPRYRSGDEIGEFVIDAYLANGANGEVYIATHKLMKKKAALKTLHASAMMSDEDRKRFVREIQNMARLQHRHIVTAISAGSFDDGAYLAMDFIEGGSVEDQVLNTGVWDERQAAVKMMQIAEALDYAWTEFTLVHRDLKPANILLDQDGNAFLTDMGIAKSLESDLELTAAGMVVGSPYYMSPEQALGESVDVRTDIYSFGATLYHMFSENPPYHGMATMQILGLKSQQPPTPLRELNPDLSEAMYSFIDKLMAIDADQRFLDWKPVIEELRQLVTGKANNAKAVKDTGAKVKTKKINASRNKVKANAIPTGRPARKTVKTAKKNGCLLYFVPFIGAASYGIFELTRAVLG